MSSSILRSLIVLAGLAVGSPGLAQPIIREEARSRPATAPTRRELDRLEALKLYGKAARLERENRLPEALRACEKALTFDPEAAPVYRSLVTLYLALERDGDALKACRRVLELDPGDYHTWQRYSAVLRSLERDDAARAALRNALRCEELEDDADAHATVLHDLGVLYEQDRDYDKAEKVFRQVIALLEQPDSAVGGGRLTKAELAKQAAEVYERIGRVCLRADRPDRAVEAFEKARDRDPARAARLSLNLAEVLAEQRRLADALRHLDQYLARRPQGVEGYKLKVKLLRQAGRDRDIVAALEGYSRKDPGNKALKLLLAREYGAAGQTDRAEAEYQRLLVRPTPEAYRGLFALYKKQGAGGVAKLLDRLNGAVAAARPGGDQAPDPARAAHVRAMLIVLRQDRELVKGLLPAANERLKNGPALAGGLRVTLAALAERTDQLDLAERLYRSCLDEEGRVTIRGDRGQAEPRVYSGLLRVLSLARKHEEIVKLCRQGLKQSRGTHRVLFYLDMARAQMMLGRAKEALEAAKEAVNMAGDTNRLLCRSSRASLLSQAGRHREAEAECLDLLREYKEPADARGIRLTLHQVYGEAGKADLAEKQLKLLLKADPNDALVLNNLGYFWADRNKNLDEAERMVRKAIELDRQERAAADALGLDSDRDNAAYVDSLGWVLLRKGRLREAREQLEAAAALPDGARDPVVWDHLGDVYFRLGETRQAAAAWKQAVKLYDQRHRLRDEERYQDIRRKLTLIE